MNFNLRAGPWWSGVSWVEPTSSAEGLLIPARIYLVRITAAERGGWKLGEACPTACEAREVMRGVSSPRPRELHRTAVQRPPW